MSKKIRSEAKIGLGLAAALIVAAIGFSFHHTVPVGEEAAVSSWGKVKIGEIKTGANFKAPWETYDSYNLQSRTFRITNAGIAAQDKFKNGMTVEYTGRFLRGSADKIRSTTGTADIFLNTHVHPTVRSCMVKAGLAQETSQDFFAETAQVEMAEYVMACTNEYLSSAKVGGGYEVAKVQFSDINLDARVEKFMVKTKERLEAEEQQNSDARIAESKAREKIAQYEADAEAAKFRSVERKEIADAKFYENKRQAEANLELGKSITPELIEYIRANRWDGKYPGVMTGSATELQIKP